MASFAVMVPPLIQHPAVKNRSPTETIVHSWASDVSWLAIALSCSVSLRIKVLSESAHPLAQGLQITALSKVRHVVEDHYSLPWHPVTPHPKALVLWEAADQRSRQKYAEPRTFCSMQQPDE